jgi:CDP-diacylglycerol pyrophosphatase
MSKRSIVSGAFAVAGVVMAWAIQMPANAQTAQGAHSSSHHAAASCTALPSPPDTLWTLAECCAKSLKSNPSCLVYDNKDKYVIIKDNNPKKPVAYLLMPSIKVTGIEDPQISKAPVVAFWEYAWKQSQTYLKPPAKAALAINSVHGRDQNQLHIHISCVQPEVKKALDGATIGVFPAKPVALQLPPHNNTYEVVKVTSLDGKQSPFLVIQEDPRAKAHMGSQSIAVVGTAKANEYFVLNTYYHGGNPGTAEELLDQTCAKK